MAVLFTTLLAFVFTAMRASHGGNEPLPECKEITADTTQENGEKRRKQMKVTIKENVNAEWFTRNEGCISKDEICQILKKCRENEMLDLYKESVGAHFKKFLKGTIVDKVEISRTSGPLRVWAEPEEEIDVACSDQITELILKVKKQGEIIEELPKQVRVTLMRFNGNHWWKWKAEHSIEKSTICELIKECSTTKGNCYVKMRENLEIKKILEGLEEKRKLFLAQISRTSHPEKVFKAPHNFDTECPKQITELRLKTIIPQNTKRFLADGSALPKDNDKKLKEEDDKRPENDEL